MRKIIDYEVVCDGSITALEIMVRDFIEDGWQPYGSFTLNEMSFYQAMVKYADDKIELRTEGGGGYGNVEGIAYISNSNIACASGGISYGTSKPDEIIIDVVECHDLNMPHLKLTLDGGKKVNLTSLCIRKHAENEK